MCRRKRSALSGIGSNASTRLLGFASPARTEKNPTYAPTSITTSASLARRKKSGVVSGS